MSEELTIFLKKYEDGVPVKIERSSILLLSVAAIVTVAISAVIIKYVKKL